MTSSVKTYCDKGSARSASHPKLGRRGNTFGYSVLVVQFIEFIELDLAIHHLEQSQHTKPISRVWLLYCDEMCTISRVT